MPPLGGPDVELQEKHGNAIIKFVSDVRCGKLVGSQKIALATLDLLEVIISDLEDVSAFELLHLIRSAGCQIVTGLPRALSAASVTRRLLKAIRDEAHHHAQSNEGAPNAGESLQRLVLALGSRRGTLGPNTENRTLRDPLREHVCELRLELESSSLITAEASRHAHADELIMTMGGEAGGSDVIERVLRAAANRRARIMLIEGHDIKQSHSMAARLASNGASVTVAGNAAITALMPRVNKVMLSVEAVLPGGALLAARGARALTAAAQHYSVPVIALCPLCKLCPLHACALQHLTDPATPHSPLEGAIVSPGFDYIPPDYVTLFITNLGGSSPSYIYRLLSELYDPRDYDL